MVKHIILSLVTISIIAGCASKRALVRYKEYDVMNYNVVIDSLLGSGNGVSKLDTIIFTLDNSERDTVLFGTFIDEDIVGSIQIRKIEESYNVILIKHK